jgi:hypothetical protein
MSEMYPEEHRNGRSYPDRPKLRQMTVTGKISDTVLKQPPHYRRRNTGSLNSCPRCLRVKPAHFAGLSRATPCVFLSIFDFFVIYCNLCSPHLIVHENHILYSQFPSRRTQDTAEDDKGQRNQRYKVEGWFCSRSTNLEIEFKEITVSKIDLNSTVNLFELIRYRSTFFDGNFTALSEDSFRKRKLKSRSVQERFGVECYLVCFVPECCFPFPGNF